MSRPAPSSLTPPLKSDWRWLRLLASCALVSCSPREEPPPPPAATTPSSSSATQSARAPAPVPSPTASPDVAASSGANLDQVVQNAEAFSDMIAALRDDGRGETRLNTDTLDLEAFIRGKSERDLLKFGEATQFIKPFAAMQVLGHLFRHSSDPKVRMDAAILFGDAATLFGGLKDRALARDCADQLIAWRGEAGFTSALTSDERIELLHSMHRIVAMLDRDASPWLRMAAALRNNPFSDEDLSVADAFEAQARLQSGRAEDLPAMRALFESIRARGVYAEGYADRESVDRVLAWSEEEAKAQQAAWVKILADNRAYEERLRSIDPLPPAQRLAELERMNQAAEHP